MPGPGAVTFFVPGSRGDREATHADIVLVLDMSTSMQRPTRGGRTKMEAAVAAVHSFAALLDLDPDGSGRRDQLGVVGFNGQAWTAAPLGGGEAAIAAAIDGLPQRANEGTRLDLALRQGQALLTEGRQLARNQPVIVLMTDGLPNQVPFGAGSPAPDCPDQECAVLRAASAVKTAGTRLFAIGLGQDDDILRALLQRVASTPADCFVAPDGEDLAAIYLSAGGRQDPGMSAPARVRRRPVAATRNTSAMRPPTPKETTWASASTTSLRTSAPRRRKG